MPIRCCCRVPSARAWRRTLATRGPSGCGGAALPVEQAEVLFEAKTEDMTAFVDVDRTGPAVRIWYIDQARLLRLRTMAGRCDRSEDQARPADRHLDPGAWGLAGRQAALGLDSRRKHPPAGHAARDFAVGVSRAATAISPLCSSPRRAAHCRVSSSTPAGWCCRFSTN